MTAIEQLASVIAERLRSASTIDLWDAEHVAGVLGMKVKYFREHVAPAPGFPHAIRLPLANGGKSTARWKAAEVLEWIDANQERRAA